MKLFSKALLVAVVLFSVSAIAASFDGNYSFTSRIKSGTPDMVSWTGTMTIGNGIMNRQYASPDGKDKKFYEGSMVEQGNLWLITFTKAYKPEYVGKAYKNKLIISGKTLTIEAEDGSFKEVWTKK